MNAIEACGVPGVAAPIVGAPGAIAVMATEKLCVEVPEALVAVTTPVNVPAAFGVPLSTPVAPFRVSPPGSAPDVTLKVGAALPVAV